MLPKTASARNSRPRMRTTSGQVYCGVASALRYITIAPCARDPLVGPQWSGSRPPRPGWWGSGVRRSRSTRSTYGLAVLGELETADDETGCLQPLQVHVQQWPAD